MTPFDAIVIGTGQGGAPLAVKLGAQGLKTAVIERGAFGGTCVNVGCTPTKAYVACARAAHVARNAEQWGVQIKGSITVDLDAIKTRKDEIIGRSREGVEQWLRSADNVTVFNGHARFIDAHSVSVTGADGKISAQLSADKIFINTGTRPLIPEIAGLETVRYYTNSSMLELTNLPSHLVIIGGSYIALEFAQIFRRFGSRVTVLVRGQRILGREDEDVALAMQDMLSAEGIQFRFGAEPSHVEPTGHGGVKLWMEADVLEASHLLLATGRTPNTDDLGLGYAHLPTDHQGLIAVDGQLRTSVPGVWAIGDINGRGAFTHTSYDDYQIVAANLFDGAHRSVDDRIMAYAVFTDPPLARVGLSESDVRRTTKPALIATLPMQRVGRARERGETTGFMKVLVDERSERIIGASILGIEADEAIHTFIDTMRAGASYRVLQRAMHIHPTVSELVPTLLDGLQPLKPAV
ncbi:FAD-containing oxidoreductase [Amantichitinum ursilacus]|uniref:Glutathione amide reductase n=1 Tax=Amantichitinum ursilacus TaxID=857265 RepID=A0A0N0XMC4_9NEIS|nr:FAD-containing oxidoreductase [Amantichitinum ursilacus]KPC54994.1 Glutathione amide reductase [Amantichitinum ursilacus]